MIFTNVGTLIAERLMYTPSIGYCVLCGFALKCLTKRSVRYAICAAVLVSCAARTYYRIFDWKDDWTLHSATLRVCPNSAKTNNQVGQLHMGNTNFPCEHWQ
jgi:hypothetical protein